MHFSRSGLGLSLLALWGTHATHSSRARVIGYDCEPRLVSGQVDNRRILDKVRSSHLDGYDYLLWHALTDWSDFQSFLAQTDTTKLDVWLTITPPSEQRPPYGTTAPFGTDYPAWAHAISAVAQKHRQFKGVVIDDFDLNTATFNPQLLSRFKTILDSGTVRPKLLAMIYRPTLLRLKSWWSEFGPYLDGVSYAYEQYDAVSTLAGDIGRARAGLTPGAMLSVNLYVSGGPGAKAHRRTSEYMESALAVSDSLADVTRLYCLPLYYDGDSLLGAIGHYAKSHGHGS